MRRREFITLLGGAAAWPMARRVHSSPSGCGASACSRPCRNGSNSPAAHGRLPEGPAGVWLGRGAECEHCLPVRDQRHGPVETAALELVAAAPELIVVWSNPAVIAMRAVNRSIPVVFVSVGDPVGSGFVESLGRPGGNLTGFTAFEPEMARRLEHLKEVAPALTSAMVLLHPDIAANLEFYRAGPGSWHGAQNQCRRSPRACCRRHPACGQRALAGELNAGVLVLLNPASASHRDLIVGLASRLRLPAIYPFRYYALDGGLISYGPDTLDLFRRAAGYVDRILKGDPPASLPVQTPVKFELAINLKTAKALGLTVPDTPLARADEVIE